MMTIDAKYELLCKTREAMRGMHVYNSWQNFRKELQQLEDKEACEALAKKYIEQAKKLAVKIKKIEET